MLLVPYLPLGIGLEFLVCSFAMYLLRVSNSDGSSGWGWKWAGDANPKGNVGFVFRVLCRLWLAMFAALWGEF
jgi:hypothetical protein